MRVSRLIPINKIYVDRLPSVVETRSYLVDLLKGDKFPPIHVAFCDDGFFTILDGRHRLLSHMLAGRARILARYSLRTFTRARGRRYEPVFRQASKRCMV